MTDILGSVQNTHVTGRLGAQVQKQSPGEGTGALLRRHCSPSPSRDCAHGRGCAHHRACAHGMRAHARPG